MYCISKCSICNTFQTEQQKEPLMSHPVPNQPWEFIATDLFEHNGRDYLVTTDYFSNFCEIDRLYSTTSRDVINKLKSHIGRHGIPDRLISENWPQFNSEWFRKFAADYQYQHITSSPTYPQSNVNGESAPWSTVKCETSLVNGENAPWSTVTLVNGESAPWSTVKPPSDTETVKTHPGQRWHLTLVNGGTSPSVVNGRWNLTLVNGGTSPWSTVEPHPGTETVKTHPGTETVKTHPGQRWNLALDLSEKHF
ncbi:hypothetical protein QZH41_001012 [Actinostola sp. cb2023]|nr:hypothetical protein QZH41_001012 [Actinostola sp. cb2023]